MLFEKLTLTALETVSEPVEGGGVGDGEAIEKGDAVLWERVGIFGDGGEVEIGGVCVCDVRDEEEERGEAEPKSKGTRRRHTLY